MYPIAYSRDYPRPIGFRRAPDLANIDETPGGKGRGPEVPGREGEANEAGAIVGGPGDRNRAGVCGDKDGASLVAPLAEKFIGCFGLKESDAIGNLRPKVGAGKLVRNRGLEVRIAVQTHGLAAS